MMLSQTLLADYVRTGSDSAFRELVSSYVNFVYSTALRIVEGDRSLAEDVSQTVFTDLARKASAFSDKTRLGGWLHRHTCFVARKALRRERRRKARERQAVELHLIADYTAENLGHLSCILDEAINDLHAQDRMAILLRYFEDLDFRSVGHALGSSEDAARMRVSRALEKLGTLLRHRGVTLSIAGVGYILSTKSVSAAPGYLAATISNVALSNAAKGLSFLTLMRQCCFTRLNIGLVSAAVVIGLATLLIATHQSEAEANLSASQVGAAVIADEAQDQDSEDIPISPQPLQKPPSPEVAVAEPSETSPSAPGLVKPTRSPTYPIPIGIAPPPSEAPTPSMQHEDNTPSLIGRNSSPFNRAYPPSAVHPVQWVTPSANRMSPSSDTTSATNLLAKKLVSLNPKTNLPPQFEIGLQDAFRPATPANKLLMARTSASAAASSASSLRINNRKASSRTRVP